MAFTDSAGTSLSVIGRVTLFRLFDVGYAIDLPSAARLLTAEAPERTVPLRNEARAIVIPNPPLTVSLGVESLTPPAATIEAKVSACLFDFGVVSLRLTIAAPAPLSWNDFITWGASLDGDRYADIFEHRLRALLARIQPAVTRPMLSSVIEDYTVFRISRLSDAAGAEVEPAILADRDIARLLLNETRVLAADTYQALLPYRFSYTPQDLVILSWDDALVIESADDDLDIEFILEMANAQILELRVFDAMLDAELTSMHDRIDLARRARHLRWSGRTRSLLTALHALVADTTEVVERLDNALKVTNDVFLARVYTAALQIFRAAPWRAGIDRKLGIVRDTYTMLNAEAQVARAQLLEVAVVVLILIELVLGLRR